MVTETKASFESATGAAISPISRHPIAAEFATIAFISIFSFGVFRSLPLFGNHSAPVQHLVAGNIACAEHPARLEVTEGIFAA